MFMLKLMKLFYSVKCFLANYGVRIKGESYISRRIKVDSVLLAGSQKFFLNHKIAGSYGMLYAGKNNENETHIFFKNVFGSIKFSVNFIDVGANIGEMIVSACDYKSVINSYGYEPNPECVVACNESLKLNGIDNAVIYQRLLSDSSGEVAFSFNHKAPTGSGLYGDSDVVKIMSTILDNEDISDSIPSVMLVDVEGAEPLVLRGGVGYINKVRPLIIFEYNELSKQHFKLEDIAIILGKDYEFFRLRGDGFLDRDFNNSWNCVALNKFSLFYDLVKGLEVTNSAPDR